MSAHLVIGAAAEVDGNVAYRSTREAEVNSAAIGGSVIQRTPLPANIQVRALQLLTLVLVMLILTAAGLLLASAWPELFGVDDDGRRKRLADLAGRVGGPGITVDRSRRPRADPRRRSPRPRPCLC